MTDTAGGRDGGDPVCWMSRVCPECGGLADHDPPVVCPRCGVEIVADRGQELTALADSVVATHRREAGTS